MAEDNDDRTRQLRPADPSRMEEADRTGPELDRLPPPVFPPGSRRIAARLHASRTRQGGGGVPKDAFIDPDEPFRRKGDGWDDAFISPDEPIVRTHAPSVVDEDDVVVTGMGDQGPVYDQRRRAPDEREISTVADRLETIARDLRERGAGAVRGAGGGGADRTDEALRAFVAGFLAGRRR